jgi:hypothetical protein
MGRLFNGSIPSSKVQSTIHLAMSFGMQLRYKEDKSIGALLASCIAPCANDIYGGHEVQNPNDSSVDEYSRPPSVTS